MTKAVDDFAGRGFRALGVARADGDGEWRLLGVLPLFDPPRKDAKSTIATARQMGIKIKMVTGDALAIARETAKTLDMGADILDGAALGDSKHDETAAMAQSIEQADGFAQVFPEHKFHIVDTLQKHGHIVGMTGDGVNDYADSLESTIHISQLGQILSVKSFTGYNLYDEALTP